MDGVYWSLFIEMRFYAMVAAVLLFGQIRRAEPLIILWLAGSAAVTFHPIGWLGKLLIADYSAYFIAGAALYLVWSGGLTWRRGGVIAGSWCLAVYRAYAWGWQNHEGDGQSSGSLSSVSVLRNEQRGLHGTVLRVPQRRDDR